MFIGLGPSMLDGELALITWLTRRDVQAQPKRKVTEKRELRVLPQDAVWPVLTSYPYGGN